MDTEPQKRPTPEGPGLLQENGAARWLGLSPKTLQRWRVDGTGPLFSKCGRLILYSVADLEAFVAQNKRRSTSEHVEA